MFVMTNVILLFDWVNMIVKKLLIGEKPKAKCAVEYR